jgi:hypothetical protein
MFQTFSCLPSAHSFVESVLAAGQKFYRELHSFLSDEKIGAVVNKKLALLPKELRDDFAKRKDPNSFYLHYKFFNHRDTLAVPLTDKVDTKTLILRMPVNTTYIGLTPLGVKIVALEENSHGTRIHFSDLSDISDLRKFRTSFESLSEKILALG